MSERQIVENEITEFGNKFIFSEDAGQLFSENAYFPERLQQNKHVLENINQRSGEKEIKLVKEP